MQLLKGAQDEKDLSSLLGACFPVEPGRSFFDDFPVWRERFGRAIHRWGIREDGALVSSAGLRLAKTVDGASIGLIGCVATAEIARGKGYASQLIAKCVEEAQKLSCESVYLWSNEVDLYARQGFMPVGEQVQMGLQRWKGLNPAEISDFRIGLDDEFWGALQSRKLGIRLEPSDRPWIAAHANVRWWSGLYRGNRGFIAIGKGIDLAGIVHEVSGDPAAIERLLARAYLQGVANTLLVHPSVLKEWGMMPDSVETLALGRALKPGAGFSERLWFWGVDSC